MAETSDTNDTSDMADTTGVAAPEQYALASVHTGLLDCIQVNLAVLADHVHGPGTHLRLGAQLRFAWWPLADGLPTADPPLASQLAMAADQLGLRVTRRERLPGDRMFASPTERGGTHYVVADAYDLPWLPYYDHAHMEHSFLLAAGPDGWHVTDAYRIDTQWGPAVPGTWVLAREELARITSAEVITLEPADLAPLSGLPPASTLDADAVESYLTAYQKHFDRARALEQLAAETWLLARARKLHTKYRALFTGRDEQTEAEERQLRAWDKVVELTYLAHRRVSRGRAEPAGVVDRLREALAADRTVFGAEAPAPAPALTSTAPRSTADETLRRRVAAVAGAVLRVPEADLLAGAAFDSFPSFSSFRLVEIIEAVETALERELDPDRLIPENLRRVDDLCRILS
ncbi:hypothetical protein SAMN04487983_1011142 [Streptomyces sp. yr375]|uniref:hypothetical protein n=1 Tax=Streptomyces sp. yr375 TaxID=1761906 RepID=UPI0008AD455F|nr:hypothetical protein [Streptomyces sp. yr375]SER13147.1 hypothetical protein SAMN04487983_1011142 [Streptomyces sp. yr375]